MITRSVHILGTMNGTDVDGPDPNDPGQWPIDFTCKVSPLDRTNSFGTVRNNDYCIDNEVSVALDGTCRLMSADDCALPDNQGKGCVADESILLSFRLEVQEEDECWTDDLGCGAFDTDDFNDYFASGKVLLPAKCDSSSCPPFSLAIDHNDTTCGDKAGDVAYGDVTLTFNNVGDNVTYDGNVQLSVTKTDNSVESISTNMSRLCTFTDTGPGTEGTVTVRTLTPPEQQLCIDGFGVDVGLTCTMEEDLHTVTLTDKVYEFSGGARQSGGKTDGGGRCSKCVYQRSWT